MQNVRQSDRYVTFARVAAKLGVEPSYVQRVAAGEIESVEVDAALKAELDALTEGLLRMRMQQEVARNGDRRRAEVTTSSEQA